MLHRAKKQNPDAIVVAVGCYVQTNEAEIEKDDCIDLAIGNNRKNELVEIIEAYLDKRQSQTPDEQTTASSGMKRCSLYILQSTPVLISKFRTAAISSAAIA